LYICINLLILEAATSKVNYLDARLINFTKKDVLWFKVAVYYVVLSHVVKRDKDLNGETFNKRQ